MEAQIERRATKLKNVLVDVEVVAEPPSWVWRFNRTQEERVSAIKDWIREFESFLRDHRSQDMVRLEIREKLKDLCSACKREWEPGEDDGKTVCLNCGALVGEESARKNHSF